MADITVETAEKLTRFETSLDFVVQTIQQIDKKIEKFDERFEKFEEKISQKFVTQEEFKPIKAFVYGVVGIILTEILGAILFLVITK